MLAKPLIKRLQFAAQELINQASTQRSGQTERQDSPESRADPSVERSFPDAKRNGADKTEQHAWQEQQRPNDVDDHVQQSRRHGIDGCDQITQSAIERLA